MPCNPFGLLWRFCPVLALALLLFPLQIQAADSWQGKVVGVVDGATLDVAKSDGQVERVRLFAIKVPAPGQVKADAAQKRTASWCSQWGDVAEVHSMGQNREGQMVARVIVGREDLAEVLSKACLARVNMRLCRDQSTPECVSWNAWELRCRDEKKGLWAQ